MKPYRIMKTSILAAFLAMAGICSAEAQQRLTLDQAIETALGGSSEINLAEMEVNKAQHQVNEAFGNALPSVDLSANFNHFLEQPVFFAPANAFNPEAPADELMTLKIGGANSYEATGTISQVLFNSAVFRGIGASQEYLDVSKEMLKNTVSNTILNVKKAFYGVLLTQDLLEITRTSLQNAEKNLDNVSSMHKAGLVAEFDLLQAEVRVENIRPNVIQLENQLKSAKDMLKVTLGLPQDEDIFLEGELKYEDKSTPGQKASIREAMKSNYQINTLRKKIQVDDAFVDLERSGYWPSLVGFVNYTYQGQANEWDFVNSNTSIVGLQFSMNIFNGWQTSNKVQQRKIEMDKTRQQLHQLEDVISVQIKQKIEELEAVRIKMDAQNRNVNLAERAHEIAQLRYKEGTSTQLEVQNAEIELRRARTNRLQTVLEYIVANAELDNLLGNVEDRYMRPFMSKIEN
ncbi:MAG: TolC family protein [Candidatus Kapaibacterium sp.]